ncbi:helix-turn-helix domain-containing protein [Bacteroides salyersiae]|uniref:helix-turn-helix domain-containing protein n=1 Tax=Bacteroides salyersiae TaxID=291644 RepID=UPI0034A33C7E
MRRAVVDIVKNKLANGDSMKEITYELGFEYPQHLTRMFKRYTGETPQEFCNRIKKKI